MSIGSNSCSIQTEPGLFGASLQANAEAGHVGEWWFRLATADLDQAVTARSRWNKAWRSISGYEEMKPDIETGRGWLGELEDGGNNLHQMIRSGLNSSLCSSDIN